jgi:hypothetical protein
MLSAITMGSPRRFKTQHQSQILPQVGGIGDADHEVGRSFTRATTQEHIVGDLFIGGQRIKTVSAGQIEKANAQARGSQQGAFLALDGDAGVIGDLLAATGEDVE